MTQASIAFFALKATTTGTFLIIDDDGSASIHTVALGACPVKAAAAGDAYLCGAGYSAASSPTSPLERATSPPISKVLARTMRSSSMATWTGLSWRRRLWT